MLFRMINLSQLTYWQLKPIGFGRREIIIKLIIELGGIKKPAHSTSPTWLAPAGPAGSTLSGQSSPD